MIFWSHPGSRQGKLRGGREGRRSRLTPQRGCCIVHQMNQQSTGRCRIERAGWKCAAAAGSATGARSISISRTEADRYRRSPESPTEHSDQICHWRFARDDSPAPSGDHFGELRSWLARATPRGALARGSRAGDAHERRGVLDGRGGVARGSLGFSRRRRRARLDRARRPRRPRNPPPRETAMPVFSNDRFPRGTRARARGRGGGRQARALARWR